MTKVGLIIGSLRKGSYTRAIATQAAELLPKDFEVTDLAIGDLPLYNQDFDDEGNVPEQWSRFRQELSDVDAIIFATPEYNRGLPAALKNAIDVGSRPYGKNLWDQKPAVIISDTPGAMGGFGANHQIRQSLVFLNMPTVQQPEAYIGNVTSFLDDNLKITNDGTIKYLQSIMDAFVDLIGRYQK
ncbi:NADPH-dependent FMN reductase [Xylocopilactobacillus apis]|uniref:Flavin reductase n=1 Tax=Xylocopilactobacillus apis TaxID=2932183 RepID=A0AAU9DQ23_9LACO|nr:NAD(P)H-dependent oxidoreductase [Xylocopilactobacillus apis]BDR55653.1 flavin reductase [Xylocopilactobacillus apis]